MDSVFPLVTVIIPAFNAQRFLAETLNSLLAQTYQQWEAIIIDDGSNDQTLAIAQEFAHNEPRLRVLTQANAGVSASRNAGMGIAEGEFIAFLDADDVWHPQKLERQVQAACTQSVDFIYCCVSYHDVNGTLYYEPDWSPYLGALNGEEFFVRQYTSLFLLPSCVMVRKSLIEQCGGFDISLRSAEDGELWLRLAQSGARFLGLSERLCQYRSHSAGLTHNGELGFWSFMSYMPTFRESSSLHPDQLAKPFRTQFRNTFTFLQRERRGQAAKPMFEAYRVYDKDGWACRLMSLMSLLLPAVTFWTLSRWLVIPLAWHFERVSDRVWGVQR